MIKIGKKHQSKHRYQLWLRKYYQDKKVKNEEKRQQEYLKSQMEARKQVDDMN